MRSYIRTARAESWSAMEKHTISDIIIGGRRVRLVVWKYPGARLFRALEGDDVVCPFSA